MKTLALDVGDRWVGSAISDSLLITCKPYKTTTLENIEPFIKSTLESEQIDTIVVGYPKTLKGVESEQTKKIIKIKEKLEKQFSDFNNRKINWILWDERLSSKRAKSKINPKASKEEKLLEHSIAAAFILQSYIDFKAVY